MSKKGKAEEEQAFQEIVTFKGAGQVIKRHRTALNLSLNDVGTTLGVSKSTVLRYEENDIPLSDQDIESLAQVFGVKPTSLMWECLAEMQPGLLDSPFGQLMALLPPLVVAGELPDESARAEVRQSRPTAQPDRRRLR